MRGKLFQIHTIFKVPVLSKQEQEKRACLMYHLGERSVRIREVESSNLFRSTRWTLDEHLLFQRRLCCDGVALMSNEQRRSRYKPWPPLFCRFISFCLGHPATPQTPVGPVHCHSISVSPGRENGQKFL